MLLFRNVHGETFKINNQIAKNQDVIRYFYWLENIDGKLMFQDIVADKVKFKRIESDKLNFGFSNYGIWLKLDVFNSSDFTDFILEIRNPDLNYVSYYETQGKVIKDSVITGELAGFESRRINHRNFIFESSIPLNQSRTFYFYVYNSRDAVNIPFSIYLKKNFYYFDNISLLFIGLFFGLGLFIILFNLYLYLSLKDIIHLHYMLYVFFTFMFISNIDGLSYQHLWPNSPRWSDGSSYIFAMLSILFAMLFAQEFLLTKKLNKKLIFLFRILKISTIISGIFSFFEPLVVFSVLGLILSFAISVVIFIFVSTFSLNKNYIPNHFFLGGFLFMAAGVVAYAFREIGILHYNLITKNSVRFGFTFESILLTIAVLERFRINQENAKKKIQESLSQIEVQNKELEIINTELEKLSVVASETDNGVAICDQKGRLEWCNIGFEKMYDVFLDDLIKEQKDSIENVIPNPYITRLLRECTITKKPVSFETLVVTKKKREIWVQTTLTPFVRHEEIQKIIVIDSDISDLKLAEKKLHAAMEKAVESDRLKTVFLGNMSHEIRTPLNGILGFSELLFEKNIPDDKKTKYLKIIRSNGDQLMRIIDDIVDISLIESNQLRVFYSVFDLKSFFYEVVEFFESHRNTVNKPGIKLTSEFKTDQESIAVYSDKLRLKQVSMNLIKNAFKFTETGEIKFGCFISQNLITFYVEDTGIGIDPSKKDIVFERFRQGDETLSRRFGGNGLGLSISKGIIENLNGSIWIDHTYKNGFRIFFSVPYLTPENENQEAKNILKKDNAKDTIVS